MASLRILIQTRSAFVIGRRELARLQTVLLSDTCGLLNGAQLLLEKVECINVALLSKTNPPTLSGVVQRENDMFPPPSALLKEARQISTRLLKHALPRTPPNHNIPILMGPEENHKAKRAELQ
jgi:hypothetical protein